MKRFAQLYREAQIRESLSDFERLLTLAHITTYQRKSGVDIAWVPLITDRITNSVILQALDNVRLAAENMVGEPNNEDAVCGICGAQPGELHKAVAVIEGGYLTHE